MLQCLWRAGYRERSGLSPRWRSLGLAGMIVMTGAAATRLWWPHIGLYLALIPLTAMVALPLAIDAMRAAPGRRWPDLVGMIWPRTAGADGGQGGVRRASSMPPPRHVSPWKNERKKRLCERSRGGDRALDALYDSQTKFHRIPHWLTTTTSPATSRRNPRIFAPFPSTRR